MYRESLFQQGQILEAEQKNPRDDMLAQIDAELRGSIANIAAASKFEV